MPLIREQVHKFDLDNDVIFTGIGDDTGNVVKSLDIFILPSKYEGRSIVLIEAMTSGLPDGVIPVGEILDMITHKYNGLLISDYRLDIELNDTRYSLIDNKQLREEMRKHAKEDFHKYSRQNVEELYLKLYQTNE